MKIYVISLFPSVIKNYFSQGVLSCGLKKGLFELELVNPRNFTEDAHKSIDDAPYGGGGGMIMLAEPLKKALLSLPERGRVVHLSAQGQKWSYDKCQTWSQQKSLTLICSRYGGVDQRFLSRFVDEEISVGDFIVSGGELPCLLVLDSLLRWLPGVLGNEDSFRQESFSTYGCLESPQWTRPRLWEGLKVPSVCLSGHHERIQKFKKELSLLRTFLLRPDLLSFEDKRHLKEIALKFYNLECCELKSCGLNKKDLEKIL